MVVNVAFLLKVYIHNCYPGVIGILKIKDQIQNYDNRRSSEKSNFVYETYKYTVIPHGLHIYANNVCISSVWSWTTTLNCVLWCCAECPCNNLTEQKTDIQYLETTPSIRFQIYHIIGHCGSHDRIPLKDKKICHMCKQQSS